MRRALAVVAVVTLAGACSHAPTPRAAAALTAIEVDGNPNGLAWDTATHTLYIADDASDRVLAWNEGRGVRVFATLPPSGGKPGGLGQVARAADGTLYVSRFGFGTTGGVAVVKADGSVGAIAGLNPTRRRIGLAVAPDGALYEAWFEKHGDGPGGEVARLSLDGKEAVVTTGLRKPVGLLVLGDSLYVSDQAAGRVLRAPLATPSSASTFAADVPGVDLLCAGPSGAILAGGGAVVYRIDASGHASTLVSGLPKVRGVAYDASARRLFVSEHDLEPGHTRHQIRVVPVP